MQLNKISDWSEEDPRLGGKKYIAIYNPKNLETLRPEMTELIGQKATFKPLWIIEDGPFVGQWAFEVVPEWSKFNYWIPEIDLDDLA